MAYQNQKRERGDRGERNFNRRDDSYNRDNGGGGYRPPKRDPLNWNEVKVIDIESVRISISQAENAEGNRMHSFSIGRIGREGRTSKFMQPRDKQAIAAALDEAFSFMGA